MTERQRDYSQSDVDHTIPSTVRTRAAQFRRPYTTLLDEQQGGSLHQALFDIASDRQRKLIPLHDASTEFAVDYLLDGQSPQTILEIRREKEASEALELNTTHVNEALAQMSHGLLGTEYLDTGSYYRNESRLNETRAHRVIDIEEFRKVEGMLLDSIPELVEGFYTGTAEVKRNGEIVEVPAMEVHDLANLPELMMQAIDSDLETNLKLVDWLKNRDVIVYFTAGTIVAIPPTKEILLEIYETFNAEYYIGVGLPKGAAEGVAEDNSTKIISSNGLKGVDTRKYGDAGITGVPARRALAQDIFNKKSGIKSKGPIIWSMRASKNTPTYGWVERDSKTTKFLETTNSDDKVLTKCFESISMERYKDVHSKVNYNLTLDALQPRNLSGKKELVIDTINSTKHIEEHSLAETTDRLKYSLALHRAMQIVSEQMWSYLYQNEYSKLDLPVAELQVPMGYQIYGESFMLQWKNVDGVYILGRNNTVLVDYHDSKAKLTKMQSLMETDEVKYNASKLAELTEYITLQTEQHNRILEELNKTKAERFFTRFLLKAGTLVDTSLVVKHNTGFQASLLTHPDYHINGELTDFYFVQKLLEEYRNHPKRDPNKLGNLEMIVKEYKKRLTKTKGLAWMFTGYTQAGPEINKEEEQRAARICKAMRRLILNADGGSFWMVTDEEEGGILNLAAGTKSVKEFLGSF